MRVTLDTNVCNVIHDPNKWPALVTPENALKIRAAIESGKIKAFVSEASLFVECLSFENKLTYLSIAGTPDERPSTDPRMIAIFDYLASIGVKLLHAPLIGAEIFLKMPWAVDEVFSQSERQKRFGDFLQPLPRHAPLVAFGKALLPGQPPVPSRGATRTGPNSFSVPIPQEWAIALKREWDGGNPSGGKSQFRKKVGTMIGEWCDSLIVGSHLAYGNDIFCTTDEGKNAGGASILHHTNRPNLANQGIRIMTPAELVSHASLA